MKHLTNFSTEPGAGPSRLVALLDPYRYVLAADAALREGNREDAVALIAQAYLAFDVLSVDCE